jgi:hypothetical protein
MTASHVCATNARAKTQASRQEQRPASSFGGGFSIEQVLTQPLTGIEHRRTMAAADLTGLVRT